MVVCWMVSSVYFGASVVSLMVKRLSNNLFRDHLKNVSANTQNLINLI